MAYAADNGSPATTVESLIPAYIMSAPECQAGGQYSFNNSGPEPVYACSTHGHHP